MTVKSGAKLREKQALSKKLVVFFLKSDFRPSIISGNPLKKE